jgi:hypothetical protein
MKKQFIILAILLILLSGNLIRTSVFNSVRTVDLLQLLAVGVLIGLLLRSAITGSKK